MKRETKVAIQDLTAWLDELDPCKGPEPPAHAVTTEQFAALKGLCVATARNRLQAGLRDGRLERGRRRDVRGGKRTAVWAYWPREKAK